MWNTLEGTAFSERYVSASKEQKMVNETLDFSAEKDNFEMLSLALHEEIETSRKHANEWKRKHAEVKRIRESVSSIDVLIMATTQALRERERRKYQASGHSSVADVLEVLFNSNNELLATEVRMFIEDWKDQEAKEEAEAEEDSE